MDSSRIFLYKSLRVSFQFSLGVILNSLYFLIIFFFVIIFKSFFISLNLFDQNFPNLIGFIPVLFLLNYLFFFSTSLTTYVLFLFYLSIYLSIKSYIYHTDFSSSKSGHLCLETTGLNIYFFSFQFKTFQHKDDSASRVQNKSFLVPIGFHFACIYLSQ